jgi:hypothetical protein
MSNLSVAVLAIFLKKTIYKTVLKAACTLQGLNEEL